jgi:hypothetical protein
MMATIRGKPMQTDEMSWQNCRSRNRNLPNQSPVRRSSPVRR